MKQLLAVVAAFLLIVLGAVGAHYYFIGNDTEVPTDGVTPDGIPDTTEPPVDIEPVTPTPAPTPEPVTYERESVLGTSAGGATIRAHHFGTGEKEVLLVGGIHGGYSWNTSLLAFEVIDWLSANPEEVPENVTVTVIPVLNPDGLEKVTGTTGRFVASDVDASQSVRVAGRFNANDVDLNRNFDCEWQESGVWQTRTVSGGTAPFSEPESQVIRTYINATQPNAVIVWYSAAGGVYSSNCKNGVLPETRALTNLFAQASGYPAHEEFDYYAITGDMVNWLAARNIPGISVLLTTHEGTEWAKNRAGIEAVLARYAD
jgi:murein tripeptide amidase MpaA